MGMVKEVQGRKRDFGKKCIEHCFTDKCIYVVCDFSNRDGEKRVGAVDRIIIDPILREL